MAPENLNGTAISLGTWKKSAHSGNSGGACIEVTTWRKSSYSGNTGGQCVEVATWRKSTHSGNTGGGCVEVAADVPSGIAVRDSKNPSGPALLLTRAQWRTFLADIKAGRLDHLA